MNKSILLVFSVFFTLLLSLSIVSASDLSENISSDCDDDFSIENTCSDNSISDGGDESSSSISNGADMNSNDNLDDDLNTDVDLDSSSVSDSFLNEDENNKVVLRSPNVLSDGSQVYLDKIIKNPSFNDSLNYWDLDGEFYWKTEISSKSHDGDNCSMIFIGSSFSQVIDFTVVDSLNFYVISDGRPITVSIGDGFAQMFQFDGGDWNLVSIDTKDLTGFLDLQVFNPSSGWVTIDDFFVTGNDLNHANFTGEIIDKNDENFTVQFYDRSYGLISGWLWDFGDGTSSTERNPIHTYKNGIYTPSLTVSSDHCTDTYSPEFHGPVIERSDESFNTIQDAIDSAIENDVIIVNPYLNLNYYAENLILNKSITLIFNNSTLLNKTSNLVITTSNKANANIRNLDLKNLNVLIASDDDSNLALIDSKISNSHLDIRTNVDLVNSTVEKNSKINVFEGDLAVHGSTLKAATLDSNNSKVLLNNTVLSYLSNVTVSNGDVKFYGSSFDNAKFDIYNSSFDIKDLSIVNIETYIGRDHLDTKYNYTISDSRGVLDNVSFNKNMEDHSNWSFGFKFINTNATFKNSNFIRCFTVINQTGGELNISKNFFNGNTIGIYVDSGISNIHYNTIYGNSGLGLVYCADSVDYSNNWWGSNNPSFIASSIIPSDYYDIAYIGESEPTNSFPYLVLNMSSDTSVFAINDSYVIHVDLTHNSNGEDTIDSSDLEFPIDTAILDRIIKFQSNEGSCSDCSIVNGKGEFTFTSGDKATATVTFRLLNQNYTLPILIDSAVPQITYITPSGVFNDTLLVEIECDDPEAVIYYTIDGSDPKNSSTRVVYDGAFTIDESTTVHVTAIDEAGNYARVGLYDTSDVSVTYLKSSDLNTEDSGAIWGEYQGNVNNTGVSNQFGPLTNISKWSRLDITSDASVLVDKDGLIYVAGEDGYLYCLNSEGKTVWAYGTRSKIISTPAIGPNGHIYFANWENSTLYELDNDGYLVWKYGLGDYNLGSSIKFGPDGTLYAISGNDSFAKVFAFKNQTLKWVCELAVSTSGSTPAISEDGTLYLILKNHRLAIINWDGTLKGYIELPDKYTFGLREDYDRIEREVSVSIGSDGIIYVINQRVHTKYDIIENWIGAYYPNGTAKWINSGGNQLHGAPNYFNGILYVSGKNNLYAFDSETGAELWHSNIINCDDSVSSPIISKDSIIYLGNNNTIYAFDLDGNLIWSYELIGQNGNPIIFSSPTLTDDGTLIVPTNLGIYAFNELGADFTWEHVNGTERGIQFTSIATEGNNTYYWRFGDYRYSSMENPIHEYFRPGNYTVYLTVNHSGVLIGCNKTIEVITHDITPPSNVIATIDGRNAIDAEYRGSQNVTLSSSDNWGEYTIYYTVDGSNPISSSTRREYYEPILIETDTHLQFVAVDPAGNYGNVGNLTLNISDAIIVNETLVEKIQKMLDEAEPNSKIVINYAKIAGANFTVNKPLNIISTNNTLLVGNGVDPVFTITPNAKGTKIDGFSLENSGDALVVNNSNDVSIVNTVAYSRNGAAFKVINSSNTLIKDSTSKNSYNGLIINGSSKTVLNRVNSTGSYNNGLTVLKSSNAIINNSFFDNNGRKGFGSSILLDNSNNVSITNTVINKGFFGIRFNNTNVGVDIINNTIFGTYGDGILFEGTVNKINVTLNTIEGSFNGLNFNGFAKNVFVTENLVWNIHHQTGDLDAQNKFNLYNPAAWTDTYGQFHNCVQVSAGSSNFGKGVFMENNIFIKNQHRSWESRHSNDDTSSNPSNYPSGTSAPVDGCAGHDYNLWDGSGSYDNTGGAVSYREGQVNLVVDRIGDSTFRLRLKNMRTGQYLTNIDPFDVTVSAGSRSQVVKFKNDSAIAIFDTASTINSVTFTISMHIKKSVSWDIPITENHSSSSKETDPGRIEGDAYDNRKPSVAPMYETDDERRARLGPDSGGSGSGNGNGNGHGTGFGNGTGSGMGEGQNSGDGNGRANIKAGDESMPGSSTDVSTVFSQSQSTGGDASTTTNPNAGGSGNGLDNAYELDEHQDPVTKSISLNDPMKIGLLILLSIFLAIGYYIARENEWMK